MIGENWVKSFRGNSRYKPEVNKFKSRRFQCDAHYPPYENHGLELGRGVDIETDDEMEDFWVTFWVSDQSPNVRYGFARDTIKQRLKEAKNLLLGRPVDVESFMFSPETLYRMGQYMTSEARSMARERIYNNDTYSSYMNRMHKVIGKNNSMQSLIFFFGCRDGEFLAETVELLEYAQVQGAVLFQTEIKDHDTFYVLEISVDIREDGASAVKEYNKEHRSSSARFFVPIRFVVD